MTFDFDYVFTVSHKNIMLLTHVGQMLYSMETRRPLLLLRSGSGQYGVTGLNRPIENFILNNAVG